MSILNTNENITNNNQEGVIIQHENENGKLYLGDSIKWMKTLESETVDIIFADPPYNIKKADWDNFESQEAYIKWSMEWIKETSRILKKTGTLYICGFSEILADLKHPASKYFSSCRWLVWHYKNKANLGKDWGRSHESILHFRKNKKEFTMNQDLVRISYGAHTLKYPSHPQAETSQYTNKKSQGRKDWIPHPMGAKPKDVIEVPTTCNGMNEKTKHPTQKPEELIRKFILASSNRGDLVLDPFSGSGTTAVVCEQLGRKWLACDINKVYNQWAINRMEHVPNKTDEEWFWYDRNNQERRSKTR